MKEFSEKIFYAHACKDVNELKSVSNTIRKAFGDCTILNYDYYQSASLDEEILNDVTGMVLSGFGRVIPEKGLRVYIAARSRGIPIYFIMHLEGRLLASEGELWAVKNFGANCFGRPEIVELTDEIQEEFLGEETILLPTYAD